ncbi:hypothetical protein MMC13_004591 [Lambiella insularis]|nr:hypothetical protein [Lambiella insularis]
MRPPCLSLLGFNLPVALTAFCQTQSQPNPIAAEYPSLTTGTLNGTVAVLTIACALARSIIPAQFRILSGYQTLLPSFPATQYPVIIESVIDHDVQSNGVSIPDFSRVVLTYPFVDVLGDGYSNFRYAEYALISATNPVALGGAAAYGESVVPMTFDPPCDGYVSIPGSPNGGIYFNAYKYADQLHGKLPVVTTAFAPTGSSSYSLDFYKNVTNQPSFGNGVFCDNFVTLYNSSVSEGQYAPVTVQGNVSIAAPYFPTTTAFTGVYGLKIDRAFIENNFMSCNSLKGYSATGSGD